MKKAHFKIPRINKWRKGKSEVESDIAVKETRLDADS